MMLLILVTLLKPIILLSVSYLTLNSVLALKTIFVASSSISDTNGSFSRRSNSDPDLGWYNAYIWHIHNFKLYQ